VLVKADTIGVSMPEVLVRRGTYAWMPPLPAIPGIELSGTVVAHGPNTAESAAIRANWPKAEILLRADSHYAAPEVFDWCRANRVDWLFGLAPNVALRRHVTVLEKSTAERFRESAPAKAGVAPTRGKLRGFMQFYNSAESWSRVERISHGLKPGRRNRYPLHCHQPGRRPRQAPLRTALLRPWPSRKPYQVVEEPPRRRSHFLPYGRCRLQPKRKQPINVTELCFPRA